MGGTQPHGSRPSGRRGLSRAPEGEHKKRLQGSNEEVSAARDMGRPWSFQKRGEAWISHEKFRYRESRSCGQSLAHARHSKTCCMTWVGNCGDGFE